MLLQLTAIGPTLPIYAEAEALYQKRIERYNSFSLNYLPAPARLRKIQEKQRLLDAETNAFLKSIPEHSTVILLDERGKSYDSQGFAQMLEHWLSHGRHQIDFVVGGAYGFGDQMRQRADREISLSKMTLPHDLVRVMFLEQLYRGFSILNNEPYHHG